MVHVLLFLLIMLNHYNGTKHDSSVVKTEGNENVVVTFTVGSVFLFRRQNGNDTFIETVHLRVSQTSGVKLLVISSI